MSQKDQHLLSVESLEVRFPTAAGDLKALDNVSFVLDRGEVLGIVGESGSGKTITGRSILRLVPKPGRITKGKVIFEGRNLLKLNEEQLRRIRGKKITAIQQDPLASLNPAFRIQDQITDIIMLHKGLEKSRARAEALEILAQLGIADAESVLQKFPHQLSGGMAQRIMIGIAFSCSPSLIIADEPTTALDVITQATVIDLMKRLQSKYKTSILFITHNLGLASKIADNIAVMYAGKIVEIAGIRELFKHPSHPYTKGLLLSVPKIDDKSKQITSIEGNLPSLVNLPRGCRFYSRCPVHLEICHTQDEIPFTSVGDQSLRDGMPHSSLCVRANELYEG